MRRIFKAFNLGLVLLAVALSGSSGNTLSGTADELNVQIDPSKRFQTIDGFGAHVVDIGGFYRRLDPQEQQKLMDLLANLDAPILRIGVPPDIERTNDNDDPNQFNWSGFDFHMEPLVLQALRDFLAKGTVRTIIASCWSPPAWMKDNNNLIGGKIKPEYYPEFAEFLAAFVIGMKQTHGFQVDIISLLNEPGIIPPWLSTATSPEELRELLKVVGAKFKALGLQTKIAVPDTARVSGLRSNAITYAQTILADPQAAQYADLIVTHQYGETPSAPQDWEGLRRLVDSYGKPLWQTEMGTTLRQTELEDALLVAWLIYRALTVGNVRAWLYWAYFTGGTDEGSFTGPVWIPNGQITVPKRYWAFWHFSKFVRPGSVRIAATADNPNLLVSAYEQGGQIVIVAINPSRMPQAARFMLPGLSGTVTHYETTAALDGARQPDIPAAGGSFTVTLDPQSIHTFILGKDSHVQQGGVAVIRRAVHKDFSRSLNESDWATVLTGSSMGLSSTTHVESPGFAVNTTVGLTNGGQSADFTITIGTPTGKTLKPLLGVNVGPIPAGNDPRNADLTAAYQQIGVTMIRTHDYYGPLDMATMYPNQNADPSNPASYDFTASDKVFEAILAGGFEPYLRLGDSWNNAPGYPPANPRRPINPTNWVRAAVEVVRHYKELSQRKGIPMRYVEIWNEPDNRRFWDGTPVEFFQLFAQTAIALKTAFPDLKIGGPGLTPAGFKAPQGQQYTRSFLEYMQRNNVSFDFFSWHIYSNDPTDFTGAALFYRELLNQYGYTKAESHITEWNTEFREGQGGDPALRTGAQGAALMTAAWIGLQQQGVDVSTFYRGTDPSLALPTFYGLFYADGRPKPVALAFSLWSQMAAHSQQLNLATSPSTSGLWMLAGQNSEGEIALLMANPNAASTSWSLAFSDGRNISDYKLILKTISDASAEIETSTPEGNVIAIGAYTVQLVIIKR